MVNVDQGEEFFGIVLHSSMVHAQSFEIHCGREHEKDDEQQEKERGTGRELFSVELSTHKKWHSFNRNFWCSVSGNFASFTFRVEVLA